MEKHILKYNGEEIDHLLAKIEQAPDAIASEAYVQTEVANLVNSAPETLDTLGEVAKAIQDNETVVEALNAAIGNKADTTYVNTELGKKANTSHTQAASTITAGTLATGMSCATPTSDAHIANKSYVDSKVPSSSSYPKTLFTASNITDVDGLYTVNCNFSLGHMYNLKAIVDCDNEYIHWNKPGTVAKNNMLVGASSTSSYVLGSAPDYGSNMIDITFICGKEGSYYYIFINGAITGLGGSNLPIQSSGYYRYTSTSNFPTQIGLKCGQLWHVYNVVLTQLM